MITKTFTIPLFKYKVTFLEVESKEDSEAIIPVLKRCTIDKEEIEELRDLVKKDAHNGGYTYRNNKYKIALIILLRQSSKKERMNTLGHEKRHLEDRILEFYSVDDIEAAGLLAGYLTEKLF